MFSDRKNISFFMTFKNKIIHHNYVDEFVKTLMFKQCVFD